MSRTLALQEACRDGVVAKVRQYLKDGRVLPNADHSLSLRQAAKNNHIDVVRLLLADTRRVRALPNAGESETLRHAALDNHVDVVRLLLCDTRPERAMPNARESEALCWAAKNGHVEVVRLLLLDVRPERAMPNARDSGVLCWAAENGHVEVVRLLLLDVRPERAMPNTRDSGALWQALYYGHVDVVRGLLADRRPDRASLDIVNDQVLASVARGGHIEVLRLLLLDDRLRADHNAAMLEASLHDRVKVVRLLLSDARPERALPNHANSLGLRSAIADGYVEVVRLLLSDPRPERAQPSAEDSDALILATQDSHCQVVRLLLADPRPGRVSTDLWAWRNELLFASNLLHHLVLTHPALGSEERWMDRSRASHQHTAHHTLAELTETMSPTLLGSMGIDWQLRKTLPHDSVWLPIQQRLWAFDQLVRQLEEDDEGGRRQRRRKRRPERQAFALARFATQHGHPRMDEWLEELLDWRCVRNERRLRLRELLPFSTRGWRFAHSS